MFCTLLVLAGRWIALGKGTGARKKRMRYEEEITFWRKMVEKRKSEMHGRIWLPLSETAKSRGGAKGDVSLEITVWILNKFDFTWFFVYPSKYQILGTACEPGLLWHIQADVSSINKNMKSFQKGIP